MPSPFTGGATLVTLDGIASSPAGSIALFAGRAELDGVTPEPDGLAIWTGDGDGLVESWPLSGPVPGAPDGSVFVAATEWEDSVAPLLRVNDAGEVAFVAAFSRPTEQQPTLGLFAPGSDGAPTLRLALGDPAPGLGGLPIDWAAPLHLSPEGTLLALVTASAGLVSDLVWYLLPRDGPPRLLLRWSDPIEIAPGDVRQLGDHRLAYDAGLTRIAARLGGTGLGPEAIAVRPVPQPCASAAGVSALAALGLLSSRSPRRLPIRMECRMRRSSGS